MSCEPLMVCAMVKNLWKSEREGGLHSHFKESSFACFMWICKAVEGRLEVDRGRKINVMRQKHAHRETTTYLFPPKWWKELPLCHQASRKSTHLQPQTKDKSLLKKNIYIYIYIFIKKNSHTLVALIWHLHIALCSLAFLKKIVLAWFLW